MLKELFTGPRIWHDVRSLAALGWLSSFALVWLLTFKIIDYDMSSAIPFLFFIGVAIVASAMAKVEGEPDD